jgi:hypothetical protein
MFIPTAEILSFYFHFMQAWFDGKVTLLKDDDLPGYERVLYAADVSGMVKRLRGKLYFPRHMLDGGSFAANGWIADAKRVYLVFNWTGFYQTRAVSEFASRALRTAVVSEQWRGGRGPATYKEEQESLFYINRVNAPDTIESFSGADQILAGPEIVGRCTYNGAFLPNK